MEEEELFERIANQGPPREADCQVLLRNLIEAVEYLHNQGIVHRDLKLENVLLASPDPNCYKTSSSWTLVPQKRQDRSKDVLRLDELHRARSTRKEEYSKGLGSYGKGADMWSVGVIAYVCLSGCPPFGKSSRIAFTFTSKRC